MNQIKPIKNNVISLSTSFPFALCDEQLGLTFNQSFISLAYDVTAIPRVDSYGCGPACLLNDRPMTATDIKLALSYYWPYTSAGPLKQQTTQTKLPYFYAKDRVLEQPVP